MLDRGISRRKRLLLRRRLLRLLRARLDDQAGKRRIWGHRRVDDDDGVFGLLLDAGLRIVMSRVRATELDQ